MTIFEVLGIVAAGTMTCFAVILTMLSAEAVKHRNVGLAILHLRWSGIMTLTSFIVMTSLFYKCEAMCWVTHRQGAPSPPAERIAYTLAPDTSLNQKITTTTPGGTTLIMETVDNGMRRQTGRSGSAVGTTGLGGNRLRSSIDSLAVPHARDGAGGSGITGVPGWSGAASDWRTAVSSADEGLFGDPF